MIFKADENKGKNETVRGGATAKLGGLIHILEHHQSTGKAEVKTAVAERHGKECRHPQHSLVNQSYVLTPD